MTLNPNGTATLTATIIPSDADNKNVTWTSADTEIAIVEGSGLTVTIRGGTKTGDTTITVKTEDGDFTANCVVTLTSTVYHTLAITNLSASPPSGTTLNNPEFFKWEAGTTWTVNEDPLIINNRSNSHTNMTVGGTYIHFAQPVNGVFTWRARVSINTSPGVAAGTNHGIIFGSFSSLTTSPNAIGMRFLTSGSLRNVYHRGSDGNIQTGTETTGKLLETVYIYEISRNAEGTYTGRVLNNDGVTVELAQWTVSGPGDAQATYRAGLEGPVQPGIYIVNATVSITEMTLTIE
jgi:hypothetical protein